MISRVIAMQRLVLLSLAILAKLSFGKPLSTDDALASFSLESEDLRVELVAAEPEVVDPVVVPALETARNIGNSFETERAMDDYLAEHSNAPISTLSDILLSGVVIPWRARGMMGSVGKTTDDPGYLEVIQKRETLRQNVLTVMADQGLDAIVYATFDRQPTLIASDVDRKSTRLNSSH